MRRITRIASTLSIALFLTATTSTSLAIPNPAPEISTVSYSTSAPMTTAAQANVEAKKFIPKGLVFHREYRAAISKDSRDLKGYEKSLYRGKYYHKDQESFRQCVMKRESHHNYRAANSVSSARGAYQFLDNNWRDGLVHMMVKESKKTDDGLIEKARALFDKPIHKWSRYWQDRAFFTAMNYDGKGSGKHHWRATVPGTGC